MNKLLKKIDALIDNIPAYIRDLIVKIWFIIAGMGVLIAIIIGITNGSNSAKPSGYNLIKDTDDLFYIKKLREANAKNRTLVEDIETNIFSVTEKKLKYQNITEDKSNHLHGEKDELLLKKNILTEKMEFNHHLQENQERASFKTNFKDDNTKQNNDPELISETSYLKSSANMKTRENLSNRRDNVSTPSDIESRDSLKLESKLMQKTLPSFKADRSNTKKEKLDFIE